LHCWKRHFCGLCQLCRFVGTKLVFWNIQCQRQQQWCHKTKQTKYSAHFGIAFGGGRCWHSAIDDARSPPPTLSRSSGSRLPTNASLAIRILVDSFAQWSLLVQSRTLCFLHECALRYYHHTFILSVPAFFHQTILRCYTLLH
jgi:hypothetical protein